MFDRKIEAAVEKALSRRTIRPDGKLTLEGYHPLPEIMGALFEWLLIPFQGADILVQVRYPRSAQLPDVDKLYTVINKEKEEKKLSRQEMIDIMNIYEACCRAVLNNPTFEELEMEIHGRDRVRLNDLKLLETLREKLNQVTSDHDRYELQKEIDEKELVTGYTLPADTMLALTNIALGVGISDIKKMTKDKLKVAYSKARLYGQRPSDFIGGLFTDGDRQNIDDYATLIGLEKDA